MCKNIMDVITEHAMNERLDAELLCDQQFLALQKKIDEQTEAFDSLGMAKEERQAVDLLISAYTESAAYYSAFAYRYGFKDCAALFCAAGIVKGQAG